MKIQDCKTKLDCWLYNLTNMSTMKKEMPFIEDEPVLERLSNIAQFVNMSLIEQEKYIHEIDDVITYNNMLRKKEDESFTKGEKPKAVSSFPTTDLFYPIKLQMLQQVL